MSLDRFRARHSLIQAVQYDGSEASIQKIRELLPDVHVNAPVGVGDQLQLDGGELHARGVCVAKASNRKFRVFQADVFEDIYQPETEYVPGLSIFAAI